MKKDTTGEEETSRVTYEELENYVRMKAQGFIQDVLEEEVTMFLGRRKSERKSQGIDIPAGYRNGYGKPRRFAMMSGTVKIRTLKGYWLLPEVYKGKQFVDGLVSEENKSVERKAA
jgi:transposase-like protein